MQLILWRHAEAEDANGKRDADRELTKHGHKQAARAAAWLRRRLPARCRIIVSPAARTLQTVAALELDFEECEEVGLDATTKSVLEAAGWPDAKGAVLVVGHQPTLGEVAERLTGRAVRVRKGAVLWLVTEGESTRLEQVHES